MRSKTIKVFLFSLIVQIVSCQTTPGDVRPEGVVIERNKQVRPVWVDLPMDKIINTETESKFHGAKIRQRDLPIAVKLTQSSAIEASYALWAPIFKTRMNQVPKFSQLQAKSSSSDFEKQFEYLSRKVHSQVSQVDDIYYEKIRIDDHSKIPELPDVAEYYDVHVLLILKQIDNKILYASIKNVFGSSKQPEWKKWAQDLKD